LHYRYAEETVELGSKEVKRVQGDWNMYVEAELKPEGEEWRGRKVHWKAQFFRR
jgi:hypothetical protein